MNKVVMYSLAFLLATAGSTGFADDKIDSDMASIESTKDHPEWNALLKEKYNFTDEQMAQLNQSGVSRPQMAMTAELAKQSGRPLEEVLKMRSEQKMGWGKVAKELGVRPGSLGQSVADMRHRVHADRIEARHDRQADRMEKRQEKREARKEKREKRAGK